MYKWFGEITSCSTAPAPTLAASFDRLASWEPFNTFAQCSLDQVIMMPLGLTGVAAAGTATAPGCCCRLAAKTVPTFWTLFRTTLLRLFRRVNRTRADNDMCPTTTGRCAARRTTQIQSENSGGPESKAEILLTVVAYYHTAVWLPLLVLRLLLLRRSPYTYPCPCPCPSTLARRVLGNRSTFVASHDRCSSPFSVHFKWKSSLYWVLPDILVNFWGMEIDI